MDKIAQLGILGFIAIAIVVTFVFLVVASVFETPGIREIPNDQLIGTTVTLMAALGGAAAARFGGKGDGQ